MTIGEIITTSGWTTIYVNRNPARPVRIRMRGEGSVPLSPAALQHSPSSAAFQTPRLNRTAKDFVPPFLRKICPWSVRLSCQGSHASLR
jgi:hypothetical protein